MATVIAKCPFALRQGISLYSWHFAKHGKAFLIRRAISTSYVPLFVISKSSGAAVELSLRTIFAFPKLSKIGLL